MKTTKTLLMTVLVAAAVALMTPRARAQTGTNTLNVPPAVFTLNFLTNLPFQTNIAQAKAGLAAGALLRSGNLENVMEFSGYFNTNYMLSLEIQNAPSSSVIDTVGISADYRIAWQNADLYAGPTGRRNWTPLTTGQSASWQGGVGIGASWAIFGQSLDVYTEAQALTSPNGQIFKQPLQGEIRAGFRAFF